MKLYNKDGKLFDISRDTYIIGRGCFGDVHLIDNNTCSHTILMNYFVFVCDKSLKCFPSYIFCMYSFFNSI
jgi:hypothetical protein